MVVDPGGSNGPGPDGGSYRDEKMDLKRQAQRFRIYGYDAQGSVVGEVDAGSADVAEISWRVHVRNMKAANYAFQGAYLFDPAKYRNPDIEGDAASPVDRKKLIIDPGPQVISSRNALPVHMKGDIFSGITEGMLPGYLRYCNFTPEDPSQPVTVRYTAARDIELGQLYLDHKKRLIFVAASGKSDCVTTPKVQLSNPSLIFNPPNGPDNGEDPLTNQFAYFNVPGWWDDTCGGEIDATVKLANGIVLSTRDGVENIGDNGTRNAKNGAWVVTAPPKYSPYMYHVVSILDRVYEAFPQAAPNYKKKTNFYRDVYPILSRASNYAWVSTAAAGVEPGTRKLAHGPAQAGNFLSPEKLAILANPGIEASPARKAVFAIMRHAEGGKLLNTLPPKSPPAPAPRPRPLGEGPISNGVEMPKLWGTGGKPVQNRQMENNLANQYLSLTDWQLARMQDWADGHFEVGELLKPVPLEQLPVAEQPLALDEAALEPTIGGGFHPGIEFPYLIAYPTNFAEAFRVKEGTEPGSIAAYMSSPWQGDYWSCNSGWWPVQRPDIVFKYDKSTGERTYREWFRGFGPHGEPLSSTDGYQQMVYAWSKLGMVLPEKDIATGDFIEADGQLVFQEFERDPALNTPPKVKTPARVMVDVEWDVIVVGGGPAGASAAIMLARNGWRVLIVEKSIAFAQKFGESLSPAAVPLVEDILGCHRGSNLYQFGLEISTGNISSWQSLQQDIGDFIFSPDGHGFCVRRSIFDNVLIKKSEEHGAQVMRGYQLVDCLQVSGKQSGWIVNVKSRNGIEALRARYLVDCSGRSAVVASSQGVACRKFTQLFAFGQRYVNDNKNDEDCFTRIEAVPDGWLYCSRLPSSGEAKNTERIVVFHTDRDLDCAKILASAGGFQKYLLTAPHTSRLLERYAYRPEGKIVGHCAASKRLDRFLGDGWLAAGDAAQAYDPLSSQGITKALQSGAMVGELMHYALNKLARKRDDETDNLFTRYAKQQERDWVNYLLQCKYHYQRQPRWADQEFWSRRRDFALETETRHFGQVL